MRQSWADWKRAFLVAIVGVALVIATNFVVRLPAPRSQLFGFVIVGAWFFAASWCLHQRANAPHLLLTVATTFVALLVASGLAAVRTYFWLRHQTDLPGTGFAGRPDHVEVRVFWLFVFFPLWSAGFYTVIATAATWLGGRLGDARLTSQSRGASKSV